MSVFTFHNSSPLPSPHLLLRAANYPSSIRSAIAYPSIEAESIVRSSTCLRFYSLSYCCPPPIAATLDILPSFLPSLFFLEEERIKKKKRRRKRKDHVRRVESNTISRRIGYERRRRDHDHNQSEEMGSREWMRLCRRASYRSSP